MIVDPATAGIITAAASLLAHPITWRLARRNNNAAAELTEAQAEQVRTEIWARLQTSLAGEIDRLQRQLADVGTRLAVVEAALVEKSAQLRAAEIERDRLREDKAALTAELAEVRAQLNACRSCTIHPAHSGGNPA